MARRKKGEDISGWVLLDKPQGLTSTRAVSRVRRAFNARKAGHAGTLDPLASGLLPIALGEATKTVPFLMDGAKTYRFTVRWGVETDTCDAEGTTTATSETRPEEADIAAALGTFTGEIMQAPPAYSAIKVDGERAYDLARAGEAVELEPRPVRIDAFRVIARPDRDHSVFEVDCGKGTYIRALARDLGHRLGCLGHVSELRRVRVGPYGEKDMILLEKLEELLHSAAASQGEAPPAPSEVVLRPVTTALDDIPALAISGTDAARLRNGQAVLLRGRDAPVLSGTVYATMSGKLVALGEIRKGELHPTRVFNLPG
jgi:tRNA pseudouridine55 synthase